MRRYNVDALPRLAIIDIGETDKCLVMQRYAKIYDKNRRFGVFMTPLSRRNKKLQSLRQGVTIN